MICTVGESDLPGEKCERIFEKRKFPRRMS